MAAIINSILLLIGLFFFFKKPIYGLFYYILWCSFACFIVDIFIPIQIYEQSYLFDKTAYLYIYICGIIHVVRNIQYYNRYEIIPLILSVLLLGYVVFLGVMRSTLLPFMTLFSYWLTFIPMWLLFRTEGDELDLLKIKKYLRIALSVEIVLAVSQYMFGFGYSSFVSSIAENGAENIVGTFRRYNLFADNVSLLVLSILIIFFHKIQVVSFVDFILILLGIILVFFSGARTEFAALLLALSFVLIARFKSNWQLLIVFVSLSFVVVSTVIANLDSIFDADSEGNEQRQLQAINGVTEGQNDYLGETSTLFLTVLLWNEFTKDTDNYLFGPGKLYESKFGYLGIVCDGGSLSDSFLALYLCETGIVGVVLLFLVLLAIVVSCIQPLYALSMVLYLLVVSLTDPGLFQGNSAFFLFLCIAYINKREQDEIEIGENDNSVISPVFTG